MFPSYYMYYSPPPLFYPFLYYPPGPLPLIPALCQNEAPQPETTPIKEEQDSSSAGEPSHRQL